MSGEFEIKLATGRTIYLRYLNQIRTYDGLLEGLPNTKMNARIINRALEEAKHSYSPEAPYLIAPVETPIIYEGSEKYPFGTPAALPGVKCEADFFSLDPARDQTKDYSRLIIVWFQEEFALPIDQEAMSKIVAIDWENIAHDDDC